MKISEEAIYAEGQKQHELPNDLELDSLFHNLDSTYIREYARTHARRIKLTINQISQYKHPVGPKILEIGAGEYYQSMMRDIFPGGKFTLMGKPISTGEHRNDLEYKEFDLETNNWPVDQNSYDIVIALEVLEHIFWDPMLFFIEINKALRLGGVLYITTPNLASWRSIRALITHYAPFLYMPFCPGQPRYVSHRREYTTRDIVEFSRCGGFESDVKSLSCYSLDENSILNKIFRNYGFSIDNRGDTIFARFVKITESVISRPKWFY